MDKRLKVEREGVFIYFYGGGLDKRTKGTKLLRKDLRRQLDPFVPDKRCPTFCPFLTLLSRTKGGGMGAFWGSGHGQKGGGCAVAVDKRWLAWVMGVSFGVVDAGDSTIVDVRWCWMSGLRCVPDPAVRCEPLHVLAGSSEIFLRDHDR